MGKDVVITGLGLITPLGDTPRQVLAAIAAGRSAARATVGFPAQGFPCPVHAPIPSAVEPLVPDARNLRLMNRDAMLAVIAARRAVQDAAIQIGRDYAAEEAGLFAATGMAGVALEEVSRMVANAADEEGRFDLRRFGAVALRQVRPVLSFKILSNMPVCFVAISEQFRGVNGVYTPWEGQGAQALVAGVRAIQHGEAACVLAGGCDTKARLLGFIALEQHGALASWRQTGRGTIPGEGACFVVLEERTRAEQRGARIYARMADQALGTVDGPADRAGQLAAILHRLEKTTYHRHIAADDEGWACPGQEALAAAGIEAMVCPKRHTGNLFAAAAAVQVALAAQAASEGGGRVLATCFGHGSQQGAFVLEATR